MGVYQQLGWMQHHHADWGNQQLAVSYLTKSIELDGNDGQTWYLLGRCYVHQKEFERAYEAYQKAISKDKNNPVFWCSIGVLYYQTFQYRDALDAYSKAIE